MLYLYIIFYATVAIVGYYLNNSNYYLLTHKCIGIVICFWILNLLWKRRPVHCNLTPQQRLDGFIGIFNIRYAELGSIYHCINRYQVECNGNSWIPTFLTDYSSANDDHSYETEDDQKKRLNRRKLKAHQLYHRYFKKNPYSGCWEESELCSLGIALLHWSSSPSRQIRLLTSIPCDAVLRKHIRSLIREYRLMNICTLGGNYRVIFSNWFPLSYIARERYTILRRAWEDLWQSLTSIVTTSQCAHMANPKSESMAALQHAWEQCTCLAEMERYLNSALSKEKNEFSLSPSSQTEEKFFDILKSNPIWKNFDGYESPKKQYRV